MLKKLLLSLASAGLVLVSPALADTLVSESFSNNPAADGWRAFGDTNLFVWNAADHDLQVTWDSSKSNSYFYHPLGMTLTSNDDFSVDFDIQLNDASTNSDGSYQFELAIGFLNLADAENTNFLRGTGDNATNLAEFDYFPPDDQGDEPSLSATLIDTNGDFYFPFADLPMVFGTLYHVTIHHPAGTTTLTGEILAADQVYAPLPLTSSNFYASTNIGDFRLDTISVSSYSDVGGYGSSILAHGTVQNIVVTGTPIALVAGGITNNLWQAEFWTRTNWNYTLQKSSDLQTWSSLIPTAPGTGGQMTLQDTNALQQSQFYRIRANPQ